MQRFRVAGNAVVQVAAKAAVAAAESTQKVLIKLSKKYPSRDTFPLNDRLSICL